MRSTRSRRIVWQGFAHKVPFEVGKLGGGVQFIRWQSSSCSLNSYRGRTRTSISMAARLVPQPSDGPKFASPIKSYDVHIYFFQTDEASRETARSLREECIEKFPDLNIYKFWEDPIGPHPTGMFEVDLKTPDQFTRFVPWIQVNRRMLSVLVHPNTGYPLLDHTVHAIWIGEKVPLITTRLPNQVTG
ncbi:hypothetical protein R1sor_021180 [Riccia sorocarpa]|uniref:Uncharacterized protein n=1 Tax=Riccia sorocarpa TaxID=122646 RepID=A0ABD3GIF4_9MARC